MSALDWLKEQLEGYGDPFKCEIEWGELDELFEQAKEMNIKRQKLEEDGY